MRNVFGGIEFFISRIDRVGIDRHHILLGCFHPDDLCVAGSAAPDATFVFFVVVVVVEAHALARAAFAAILQHSLHHASSFPG
jgi:hypothetical protein